MEGCEAIPPAARPAYGNDWSIRVNDGPHGAPDFFTPGDIEAFYAATWEVHYNSSRTGVRLIGPKPRWARADGGEAGLHPSNIHDNAYAIGSIDYTGDMPVILGPDGPSLGGFVCPATIVEADLWKLGQLKPGDKLRFERVAKPDVRRGNPAVLLDLPASATHAEVCVRRAGESNVLVEFGAATLDLVLRFQVQALLEALNARRIAGILDLTPGIRSLQIHFDAARVTQVAVLDWIVAALARLPSVDRMRLPSRIVHLPLSWDDPATQLATQRYQQSVRADAPWCPDNIEFIRRINGLESREAVRQIVFDASYLVMGLGDVYLGCAGGDAARSAPPPGHHQVQPGAHLDARECRGHRRRLSMRLRHGRSGRLPVRRAHRADVEPLPHHEGFSGRQTMAAALLRPDPLHPVSADELLRMREGFPYGKHPLRIEESTLDLGEYLSFLERERDSIEAFRRNQRGAFAHERERWRPRDCPRRRSWRRRSSPSRPRCPRIAWR
jgi:urea carboxylase